MNRCIFLLSIAMLANNNAMEGTGTERTKHFFDQNQDIVAPIVLWLPNNEIVNLKCNIKGKTVYWLKQLLSTEYFNLSLSASDLVLHPCPGANKYQQYSCAPLATDDNQSLVNDIIAEYKTNVFSVVAHAKPLSDDLNRKIALLIAKHNKK